MTWTDERIEQLKTFWANGQSASTIAAELGHVTRNAVIGNYKRFQNCCFSVKSLFSKQQDFLLKGGLGCCK